MIHYSSKLRLTLLSVNFGAHIHCAVTVLQCKHTIVGVPDV